MFSHIMLGANDVAASKAFYDAILATLGIEPGVIDSKGCCLYITPLDPASGRQTRQQR